MQILNPIIMTRWQEAHTNPSALQWYSISSMLAKLWIKNDLDGIQGEPNDDVRLLANIAHRHYADLLPLNED